MIQKSAFLLLALTPLLFIQCAQINTDKLPTEINQITGTVFAPGGQIANADLSTTFRRSTTVGAKVLVKLVEVNTSGTQIGEPLATSQTESNGDYVLNLELAFKPGPNYVVRAEDSDVSLDARAIGQRIDIDPLSNAISSLISLFVSDFSQLDINEVQLIQRTVETAADQLHDSELPDPGMTGTALGLSQAIESEALADAQISRIIASTVASGRICGLVTDIQNNALADIQIVVKDLDKGLDRAFARTDDDGEYCVDVPVMDEQVPVLGERTQGQYIIGSLNRTSTTSSAGEWWSNNGESHTLENADPIALTKDVNRVDNVNFQLKPGIRIQGKITAYDVTTSNYGIKGVDILVIDLHTRTPIASAKSKNDGSYRINVAPGQYIMLAVNQTSIPFASEYYSGELEAGTSNQFLAQIIELTLENKLQNVNFTLDQGYKLYGSVIEMDNPVESSWIKIENFSDGPYHPIHTNRFGKYRVWLRPQSYNIYTYGQSWLNADLTSTNVHTPFNSTVAKLPIQLVDITDPDKAVKRAKISLFDINGEFKSFTMSDRLGKATLYTNASMQHRIVVQLEHASHLGSFVYHDAGMIGPLSNGTGILLDALVPSDELSIRLLPGGVLNGVITSDGNYPVPGATVILNHLGINNKVLQTKTINDGTFVISMAVDEIESTTVYTRISIIGDPRVCDNIPIQQNGVTNVHIDLSSGCSAEIQ